MASRNRSLILPMLIATILLLILCGCTDDTIENNGNDSDLEQRVFLPGQLTIVGDFSKLNVTKVSIRTGVKKYIDKDNPQTGLQFSYLDGFKPDAESDAGVYFYIRGNVQNLFEDTLENITVTANFTDINQKNLNIFENDTIRSIPPGYTGLFEIYLHDDVINFDKVEYAILTFTIGE